MTYQYQNLSKWYHSVNAISIIFVVSMLVLGVAALFWSISSAVVYFQESQGYTKEKLNSVECIVLFGEGTVYCPVQPFTK